MTVSRRTILKSIGIISLGSVVSTAGGLRPARAQEDEPISFPPRWNGEPLGRIASGIQNARAEPTTDSEAVAKLFLNDAVRVKRVLQGQKVYLHNDLWLETNRGYLYSSFVQPMWYHLPNPPVADLGEGRWAEVTVPATDAFFDPDPSDEKRRVSTQNYGSVYRVTNLVTGEDGKSWYKVEELYQRYYMRATHLRIIPDDELTPISSDVDPLDKWIDIDLVKQTLVAYEGDKPVFAHYVSTGTRDWPTPEGVHYVVDKRPSTRMIGGAASDNADLYDLPGVPFVCYFTWEWAALHGAWWHNDYGQPRSHGCVNLPPRASRWLWRWTTPVADPNAMYVRPKHLYDGTKIVVHY